MASVLGTAIKFNVGMTPIDGFHLANVDFVIEVFSSNGGKKIAIPKTETLRVDDDNYLVMVDSKEVGSGDYYLTLWVDIPDTDFPSGIRKEGKTIKTNVTIEKR